MKALKMCVNGCGVPPCPPSKVFCRECMDKISEKFDRLGKGERIDDKAMDQNNADKVEDQNNDMQQGA